MTLDSSNPTLTVRHTGQVFLLGHAPVTIGGQEECTIVLADPEVSPLHAIISWQGGGHMVADAGSAKGTYLDGRRLRGAQPLRNGSVLRTGDTFFDVQIPLAKGAGAGLAPARPTAAGSAGTAGAGEWEMTGTGATDEPAAPGGATAARQGRPTTGVIIGLIAGAFVGVCLLAAAIFFLLDPKRGGPNVTLKSPKEDAQVTLGVPVSIQASATGAKDITRLELGVDGTVVGSSVSTDAGGQSSLKAELSWIFDRAGPHTVTATVYTAGDRSGTSVTHQVTVVDGSGAGTPAPPTPGTETPTATPTPTGTETPTPSPTPTATPDTLPLPVIEFFRAAPETIGSGECATLEWGQVAYAVAATIDHGIGGVATPGSQVVCPADTTLYTMSASGPGGVTTQSVTVTVLAGQPDLVIDSVSFDPYPPVQGRDTQVRIVLRNAGSGAASAFGWEWQAGSSGFFSGMVEGGLASGGSTTASLTWRPDAAYTELLTVARVDAGNAVAESNEANNELRQTIEVSAAGVTIVLPGEAGLDGYVTRDQGAYPAGEVRVGSEGASAHRGFLSFDLRAIPLGVSITDVRLRFYQLDYTGRPYQRLGSLTLTLVDYGPSLDVGDFDALGVGPLPLGKQNQPGSWYEVSSGALGQWLELARNAGLERLQFRLRFEEEAGGGDEPSYIRVEAGDNSLGTGNVPELVVSYSGQ
ncbi:MAG TPA: CARDB domain-containing protein [Anaerolineae bacterium]|nr:CARDB domain-containing protein [Anaerolineae bacterium]